MVKIRLSRGGSKKRPFYRVVAVDSRRSRETRVIEFLGTYAPLGAGSFSIRKPAYDRWVSQGAQVSDTVRTLVERHAEEPQEVAVEAAAAESPAAPAAETPAAEAPAAGS